RARRAQPVRCHAPTRQCGGHSRAAGGNPWRRGRMNHALLTDLRVIESSAFVAAPLAGLTLAQFGADVIRIDPIGGGIDYGRLPLMPSGRSLYWTGLNKGKRSLAVDLRNPQGRELIQELAAATGVLLTNIP